MDIFNLIWPNLPDLKGVRIDLARGTDASPIGLLSRKYIEGGLPGWVWNPAKVLNAIQDPDSMVVVTRRQEIINAAAIIQFGRQTAHLNLLVVAVDFQRTGIGSCLLRFMENAAYLYGKSRLNLEVRASSDSALRFYRALGYHQTEFIPGYYHTGETAVRMSHRIHTQPSAKISLSSAP
ncbi:MAG: GNAT family N-acetyltransferase [bacterium]